MKNNLLSAMLKKERKELLRLASCKLFGVVSSIGAAYMTAYVIDGVFLQGMAYEEAVPPLVVLLLFLVLATLAYHAGRTTAERISANVRQDTRENLHRSLLTLSPLDATLASSGRIFSLFAELVDGLDDFYRSLVPLVIEGAISLPLLISVALFVDPWTAGLFFLTFPISPFLLYLIGRITGIRSAQEWGRLSSLTSAFSELLYAVPSLKIWNRAEAQIERLKKLSDDFSESSLSVLKFAFLSAFTLELITTLSIAIIAVSIGLRLLYGELDFFSAFFALLLAPLFYQPLRESGIAFHAGVHAMAARKEIDAFLISSPTKEQALDTHIEQTPFPPSLSLVHVSFSYPGRKAKALDDISMEIPANRLTVLRGTSGAGKSTVLRLFAGFIEPGAGAVYLNDKHLSHIDPHYLATRMTYIPQEPHVFRATLRENVSLIFDEHYKDNDDAIYHALSAVSLSYLATNKEGLDTRLGQGAQTLSFGERRRLGLARAIYQDKPIWLLDEITAGLDKETEESILASLKDYRSHRTILMTAHRPAVMNLADHIITL